MQLSQLQLGLKHCGEYFIQFIILMLFIIIIIIINVELILKLLTSSLAIQFWTGPRIETCLVRIINLTSHRFLQD